MLFSSWLRNWKRSLERRSALKQILHRRSSGRRFVPRPRLEVLEDRTLLSTYLVTNTGDNGGVNPAAGADTGTLRQAIVDADAAGTGTAANPDQIQFDIPTTDPGYNSTTGAFTIQPLSALPTITDIVTLDATSQPSFTGTPIILLDGASSGSGVVGLAITAGNSTVEGLDINQFSGDGIDLTTNGGDVIEGDYIGTDATGSVALSNNGFGVLIESGAQNNTIGGTTTAARNVISGNGYGVGIGYSGTTGNVVEGDYIGTDVTGTAALTNVAYGVFIYNGAQNNTIGGTTTAARNVISGNLNNGVEIDSGATGNVVEGDYIGSDVTDTEALGNNFSGIAIRGGASNNTIGGTCAGAGNVISGNGRDGVDIFDSGTNDNLVEGNYIGTDATGSVALANGNDGVAISLAQNTTIGGTTTTARNVISGNINNGVEINGGNSSGTTGNVVEGDYIGTDATGGVALANGNDGVAFDGYTLNSGASDNTIGGMAAGAGNVISGNVSNGVYLADSGTTGNMVLGNLIGTNGAGTAALPNSGDGVLIASAQNNTIGGTTALAANIISGNTGDGIGIFGTGTSGNVVEGDYIGTDVTGKVALANGGNGITIFNSDGNTIGGATSTPGTGAGNVISGNSGWGVWLAGASNNSVLGNLLGINASGTAALGNGNNDIEIDGNATGNTIGGSAVSDRNIIVGAGYIFGAGVELDGTGPVNNVIANNYIGTDITGEVALGNLAAGVQLYQVPGSNTIGLPGAGNLISGNGYVGINLAGSSGALVQGNLIGTNASGTASLANGSDGILIGSGASANTIGGTSAGSGNIISGNSQFGIELDSGSNLVEGNYVGIDVTGTVALPNQSYSDIFVASAGNTIGGLTSTPGTGAGNVISGNSGYGVLLSNSGAADNLIQGNLVGTNAAGTGALGNGAVGVLIASGAGDNTIGGASAAARNVISGNVADGVEMFNGADDNLVAGNYVGTDITGTFAIGNHANGVGVDTNSTGDTIGGTAAGAGNVISGNLGNGVAIYSGANLVEGNLIGTDATGTHTLGNALSGVSPQSSGNTIGGTAAGAGNVISGNGSNGIEIDFGGTQLIQGNKIGTDITGTVALGNSDQGVQIDGQSTGVIIGGTASGAGNLISGNQLSGVVLYSGSSLIEGNLIGTSAAGTAALANLASGVAAFTASNTIGGDVAGAGNVISGNGTKSNYGDGIVLWGGGTTGNWIAGNRIGTDASGTVALANGWDGIAILSGAADNTIGGTVAAARNVIGASGFAGIELWESGAGTLIEGNYIGTNAAGTAAIANDVAGILIQADSPGATIGGAAAGAGNLISGNSGDGINLASGSSLVEGNFIGTDSTGTLALANGGNGITMTAANNTITAGNVIAFNATGVMVQGAGTNGNSILGNSIHDNSTLGIQLVSGGNDNQAAPVLTSASSSGSGTTVSGILTSTANTTFRIEFFSNAGLDASGNAEGQTYLGYTTVTTDNNGNASFTATNLAAVPAGQGYLTATATNQNTGDTSPFSNAPTSTILTSTANPSVYGQSITFTATVSSSFGTPTGNVDFFDTTTNTDLGSVALANGVATLATSALGAATHVIEANYGGGGYFLSSSSTLTQVINKAQPYFSLVTPPTVIAGTSNTQITGSIAAGSLIPPGSVTVTVNSITQTATIDPTNGSFAVSVPTSSLGTGSYSIVYNYAGSSNFYATSGTATMSVANGVLALFDQDHAKHAGSTIPIQIELISSSGQDLSSASTTVTALGMASTTDTTDRVGSIDTSAVGTLQPVQASGNANPNNVFREQGGSQPFYMYNLQTPKGLTAGTYRLYFSVSGDPLCHWVTFSVD